MFLAMKLLKNLGVNSLLLKINSLNMVVSNILSYMF